LGASLGASLDTSLGALRRKRRLEPRHKTVAGGKSVASGERIAQCHDMNRGLGRRDLRIHCAKEQRTTGRDDLVHGAAQPI